MPSPSPSMSTWHGVQLGPGSAIPDVTLTDTGGNPYNLRAKTAGKVTALFFGYAHCPDACPATMATLALAVRRLPSSERSKLTVVFVTTDPVRDTPAVLKSWLADYDPSFVGLTETGVTDTTDSAIIEAEVSTHLPVAQTQTPLAAGQPYGLDHSALVLVYTAADGRAHLGFFYQSTAKAAVTAAGEAADLQELIEHGWHQ